MGKARVSIETRLAGHTMGAALLLACLGLAASPQNAPPPLPPNISPKAQALLDRTIRALGGQAFLEWKTMTTRGRVYAIEDGQTAGLAPFESTVEPPDKRRFSYGKSQPVILINNGDQGWQIDRFGTTRQPPAQIAQWKTANRYSLANLLRLLIHENGVLIEDGGSDFVENQPARVVEIMDSRQAQIKLYVNGNGGLPIEVSYRLLDPKTHEWDEHTDVYSDYQEFEGIQTPMHVTRYLDGDRVAESFLNTAAYDASHPANFFEPSQ